MQQIKDHTKKIALGLRTVGLINIQLQKMRSFILLKLILERLVQFRLLQKHTENRM
jgi:hypothetical protein